MSVADYNLLTYAIYFFYKFLFECLSCEAIVNPQGPVWL